MVPGLAVRKIREKLRTAQLHRHCADAHDSHIRQEEVTGRGKCAYHNHYLRHARGAGLHRADGKAILDITRNELVVCQSNSKTELIRAMLGLYKYEKKINPLGEWTGGIGVDAGATNRKLGSDMGRAVTGGGLHGKDLSKADVSVNIYAHIKAQEMEAPVFLSCVIGDEEVDGRPYAKIVEIARSYIKSIGGFERFAEWGLIR